MLVMINSSYVCIFDRNIRMCIYIYIHIYIFTFILYVHVYLHTYIYKFSCSTWAEFIGFGIKHVLFFLKFFFWGWYQPATITTSVHLSIWRGFAVSVWKRSPVLETAWHYNCGGNVLFERDTIKTLLNHDRIINKTSKHHWNINSTIPKPSRV